MRQRQRLPKSRLIGWLYHILHLGAERCTAFVPLKRIKKAESQRYSCLRRSIFTPKPGLVSNMVANTVEKTLAGSHPEIRSQKPKWLT